MLKEKHLLKKEVTDASIVPKEQFPIQGQGMVSETHDVTLFLLGAYLKGAQSPRSQRAGHLCCRFRRGTAQCGGPCAVFCLVHLPSDASVASQPWEPQCFYSNFPHEAVCADPWGQALLVSTDAGVLLVDGE